MVAIDPATGASGLKKYYGKYRATVLVNADPLRIGRLQVICPDVDGIMPGTWAMPCVPLGGVQAGMFVVPPPGAKVWVEFEQGDPNYPVWVGYFWGTPAEVPVPAVTTPPGAPVVFLQTPTQTGLAISDVSQVGTIPPMPAGGVLLRSGASSILIDPTGITITAPIVNINQGALIVKLV
jgi:hypothetical protein